MGEASALWITGPGRAEIRRETLCESGPDDVVVRTIASGVSRGTERLVLEGRVPESEWTGMRAPFQDGAFPFPVKYGYAAVGLVEVGPEALRGRLVFALHPHQDRFVVPAGAVTPVPDDVPAERAVLAANMETALNIVWDAQIAPGDRVAVIGAGVVGLLAARLAAAIPGTEVTVADIDPGKAAIAAALGLEFRPPQELPGDADVAIHASASETGLACALAVVGLEGLVVEASWYGDRPVTVPLGAAFHARRLRLVSSQVGLLPAGRSRRWNHRRRLETALRLLADDSLDGLVSGRSPFGDAGRDHARILAAAGTLCHVYLYA